MRIVVVEDESKPREGLVRLISRLDASYRVVGQARNGREGKEIVGKLSPELVITDIKMPEMDGLEMIRGLRSQGCASKFVILSGYAEFDYAKQGIVLGVRDYLLKPITAQAIEEVLKKISSESPAAADVPHPPLRLAAGALLLFHSPDRSPDSEKILSPVLRRSARRAGADGVTLMERPDPASLLFHVAHTATFQRFIQALEDEMETAKGRLLRGGLICSACPFPEGGDPRKLLAELSKSLKWSMLVGPLKVIHAELIARTPCRKPEYPVAVESAVLGALRSGDPGMLEAAMSDFRAFCISGGYSPVRLEEIAFRFFFTIANLLKEVDYPRFRSIVEKNILQRVEGFRSARELCIIIEDFISSTAGSTSAASLDAHSLPIRQALNYVRTGYRGRISLEEAAQRIGLTPEYLSSLFLKETGKNFSLFVVECRINEAKRLLASGEGRVFEVARNVGIADPRYFCRVFKKHTGLSPREYSRLHA